MSSPQHQVHHPPHGEHQDHGTRSPPGSPNPDFLIPSPIPTKRTRTYSASQRAAEGPSYYGKIKEFHREKGHGFIVPDDTPLEKLFLHISDVDGDYVPKQGDIVEFKKCLIPPKNEKHSATHVNIVGMAEGEKHETWETPVPRSPSHQSPHKT